MARIEIVESLFEEIEKKFKRDASKVFDLIEEIGDNPHKGKVLCSVAGILIKEIKYNGFRFYFIVDGFKLKCLNEKELIELLIMFVRMSDKKAQQRVIEEIKQVLTTIGSSGFK
ncbi:hypothetical protein HYV86_04925 [Candidatus Woesearchaeota archaeon]|nr:hypothetical protein [Candidatus Woesearchaeota archaeon]